jgi:aspartate/methionine/tyrosine aminotransferase
VTFSSRLPTVTDTNALSTAIAGARARGIDIIDLTESNPTNVGLPYPEQLLKPLADARGRRYAPEPFGLQTAREAVANEAVRRGVTIDPSHVVLTASTSEAYSWLFKLLFNPGDAVLAPRPSYPLFDHLTRLECVHAVPYDLEYHGRWSIDFETLSAAPPATRAVMVVAPNNPTGSYLTSGELERLLLLCRERQWALIADEVFVDYPLDVRDPVTDLAARADVLTFTLGGLSKSVGLPQLKLGWIVVGGEPAVRDEALARLEFIADTYLSVGTPVQVALPSLLAAGAAIRSAIQARIQRNLQHVREAVRKHPACDLLATEGGWSAVVRVPAVRSEERLVLDLVERERVLVHPGYFFDFPREAYIVVSLLPREDLFADAIGRALAFAAAAAH